MKATVTKIWQTIEHTDCILGKYQIIVLVEFNNVIVQDTIWVHAESDKNRIKIGYSYPLKGQ